MGTSSEMDETTSEVRFSWCQWCGENKKVGHYCKEKRKALNYLVIGMGIALILGLITGIALSGQVKGINEEGKKCLQDPINYKEITNNLKCNCIKKDVDYGDRFPMLPTSS